MPDFSRLALLVSDAPLAQEAADKGFREIADWVPLSEAEAVVVLGGGGSWRWFHAADASCDAG